jgi:hypothetical protein
MKRIALILALALAGVANAGTLGLHIGSQHFPAQQYNNANPGAHYSPANRRHCINLVPCLTVWVRLPGGNEP